MGPSGGSGRGIARVVGRFSGIALACLLAGSAAALSRDGGREEGPRAREVLALYDGAREPAPADTRIHRYAESVLNHLGFTVAYRDIREPLPPPAEVGGYAAVLTWFSTQAAARAGYLAWAEATAPAARRIIVLGAVGGAFWTDEVRAMRAILAPIGLAHEARAIELTLGTGVVEPTPRLTRFERARDPVVPTYEVVRATRPDVEAWLSLAVPAREGGGTSLAVAVSPRGGYAAAGFEIVEDLGHDRARWLIDPFAFFGRILAPEPWPVPDVTTLSGRRIAFSHVEGDGLNDVIVGPGKEKVLLARRFLTDIVEAFPDLPVTFALTPGDLDPDLGGNATPRALVAEIWAAANVEASVASYTRPFRWSFFADYARESEMALARAARPEAFREAAGGQGQGAAPAGERVRWSVGREGEYPRNYLAHPFDLAQEVEGAAAAARALLPEGKPLRLYQWTGDAKPFAAALAATRGQGLLNMNGGESRFDADYPSVAHLVPLARPVGPERQIYAVGADERPLTKAWRPIAAALRGLSETLANTEWPRRLKGHALHYHLASLGDPEALEIVRGHLAALREAAVVPVPASLYAAMATDFPAVSIAPRRGGGWRIADRGAIQTVRFDAPGTARVDLRRSQGVLGQVRHADALYVALDPEAEPAEIVMGADGAADIVGLVESRWRLFGLVREDGGWSFAATGFGPGQFRWEHVPAGAYRIAVTGEGIPAWSGIARAGDDGGLAFVVPRDGREGLTLRVTRLAPEGEAGDE